MGEAAISMIITPEGPDADLEHIKNELRAKLNPKDMKEEPIGFGLKVIKIMFIADDKKGLGTDTDKIEDEVRKIKGVGDVRTENVTLI